MVSSDVELALSFPKAKKDFLHKPSDNFHVFDKSIRVFFVATLQALQVVLLSRSAIKFSDVYTIAKAGIWFFIERVKRYDERTARKIKFDAKNMKKV